MRDVLQGVPQDGALATPMERIYRLDVGEETGCSRTLGEEIVGVEPALSVTRVHSRMLMSTEGRFGDFQAGAEAVGAHMRPPWSAVQGGV